MLAALAAVVRASRAGRADDCTRACRICAPSTRPELQWLERCTHVTWRWSCGAADCEIGIDELRDCDCVCLLWGARRFALMALEHGDDGSARIAAALRLALGPGRAASVTIVSPIRPLLPPRN